MPFDATFDRRTGIGASECGAAAGLNPYQSPAVVAARKLGLLPDDGPNDRAEVGHVLEPHVLDLFCRREGVDRALVTTPERTMVHPEFPWMFGTPDALAPGFGIEVKVVGLYMAGKFGRGDRYDDNELPPYYLAQMAWCCMITGLQLWRLAALIGTELRTYTYERNERFEAGLRRRCERLWTGFISKGRCPEPEWGKTDTEALLRAMYPSSTEGVRPATSTEIALLAALKDAHDAKGQAEEAYEAAKQRVLNAIGSAEGLVSEIANPTWKAGKAVVAVDYQAVVADLKALLTAEQSAALAASVKAHTETRAGSRRFLPRFKD